jgi:hypothetical protein
MTQQAVSYPPYVMVPVRESNGLAVAGFLIALIGLFVPTGIVALVGLLICLAALGRPPRGLAATGVIIGLFGTVIWLVITGVVLVGGLAAGAGFVVAVAAMFVFMQPETIEVTSDMVNVAIAAVEYEDKHGELPADLSVLTLSTPTRLDPWGNPYRYTLENHDPGFDVMSDGADGVADTDDDLALSRMDQLWEEAFEGFGPKMEEFGQRMERIDSRNRHIRFERSPHRYAGARSSCDRPCPPEQSPAERYEAKAIASVEAEPVIQEPAATAAPVPSDESPQAAPTPEAPKAETPPATPEPPEDVEPVPPVEEAP